MTSSHVSACFSFLRRPRLRGPPLCERDTSCFNSCGKLHLHFFEQIHYSQVVPSLWRCLPFGSMPLPEEFELCIGLSTLYCKPMALQLYTLMLSLVTSWGRSVERGTWNFIFPKLSLVTLWHLGQADGMICDVILLTFEWNPDNMSNDRWWDYLVAKWMSCICLPSSTISSSSIP